MDDQLLRIDGLEVTYHTHQGPIQALHDVTLALNANEVLGLVGESGCGKSTVAAAILQLLPPNGMVSAGRILFKGEDLRGASAERLRQIRGQDIAMIFQDPLTSLNPVFSIGAQMRDVQLAHVRDISRGDLAERAREMLQRVGIPDVADRIQQYPHQFSGGMRQRIMIAMALMSEPALLVADEPTSSLDVTLEAQILELIHDLQMDFGTATLFISHDLGVVSQLCDQITIMYAGRVVEYGPIEPVFERPLHPYTSALLAAVPSRHRRGCQLVTIPGTVPSLLHMPLGCAFADRCPRAQPVCENEEPPLVEVDGRQIRCHAYVADSGFSSQRAAGSWRPTSERAFSCQSTPGSAGPASAEDDDLVRVESLSTHYTVSTGAFARLLESDARAVVAVDEVDLVIRRGEILGLVGESGSGKTTLGKTILGLVPSAEGRIVYDGRDLSEMGGSERRRLRSRMQMIFQDPHASLSPRLRVSALLQEPYVIHRVPQEDRTSVSEMLRLVGLSDEQATKYPHELSGGQARRVGIARALALRPELLIADEPTSGLDVSVAASILNLMSDLSEQLGLTYLIITHNLNIVGYIAQRVAVMYLGKLVEIGPTDQIFDTPRHPYTIALLSAVSEPDVHARSRRRRLLLQGEIPSPKNPPPGCRFNTRCPFVRAVCRQVAPELVEVGPGQQAACHFWREIAASRPQAA